MPNKLKPEKKKKKNGMLVTVQPTLRHFDDVFSMSQD